MRALSLETAGRGRSEEIFQWRDPVDGPDPETPDHGCRSAGHRERTLYRIEPARGERIFAATLALVAAQHVRSADVAVAIARVAQHAAQARDIAKAEIHALPGQRMHDVRGVAGEHATTCDIVFSEPHA